MQTIAILLCMLQVKHGSKMLSTVKLGTTGGSRTTLGSFSLMITKDCNSCQYQYYTLKNQCPPSLLLAHFSFLKRENPSPTGILPSSVYRALAIVKLKCQFPYHTQLTCKFCFHLSIDCVVDLSQ